MSKQEIQSILSELKAESANIKPSDTDAVDYINQLINKLERLVSEPEVSDHHSLLDHMRTTIGKFEVSHPKLTAIVNELMVKLAGLGI